MEYHNIRMMQAEYADGPMDTVEKRKKAIEEMIEDGMTMAREMIDESGEAIPLAYLLAEDKKYLLEANDIVATGEYGIIGEMASEFNAFAALLFNEGWMAKADKFKGMPREELEKIKPSQLPSDKRYDVLVFTIVAYHESLNFGGGLDAKMIVKRLVKQEDGKVGLEDLPESVAGSGAGGGTEGTHVTGRVVEGIRKPVGKDGRKGFFIPLTGDDLKEVTKDMDPETLRALGFTSEDLKDLEDEE